MPREWLWRMLEEKFVAYILDDDDDDD